jgi:hypothetical protein
MEEQKQRLGQVPDVVQEINLLSPTAKEWLLALLLRLIQDRRLELDLRNRLRGYLWNQRDYLRHDHRHYLLFGHTPERLAPLSWIEASWNFIQRFPCNFGFFVTEAMLYPKVTIVGAPDLSVPVNKDEEKFLREYIAHPDPNEFELERLWVRTAKELQTFLDERVTSEVRFVGGDVGPHAPVPG